jgi:small subunit ribosomal protein S16
MSVKIRFARIGKKHAPIYRIVAVDSRNKRDGKFLENLGTYNPKTKELVQFHDDRVAYWMSVGAIPTDVVARLIKIRRKQNPALKATEVKSEAPAVKKEAKKPAVKAAAPKKTETKAA